MGGALVDDRAQYLGRGRRIEVREHHLPIALVQLLGVGHHLNHGFDRTAQQIDHPRIDEQRPASRQRIVAQKRIHLTKAQAGKFYEVHAARGFYDELCTFMASEPVVVQVLEGEGAIAKNREVMGATNPADAAPGTIRAEFAESVGENSVHGSDAPDTAKAEIAYFFSGLELVG
jgi:nucleoside-diphosphate kinase